MERAWSPLRLRRRAWAAVAAVLLASCKPDSTAILIEVLKGDVPQERMDQVTIQVQGPGLPPEGRRGKGRVDPDEPDAFPLTIVLAPEGFGSGPFQVTVTGFFEGDPVARGVGPTEPLEFVHDTIVHKIYVLQLIGTSPVGGDR